MIDSKSLPAGIQDFILVAELGSFSKAAQVQNVSRARMSQIISQLENQLGVQLLHRSTRSLALTQAGKSFYEQSRKGLDQLNFAVESAKELHSTLAGYIRVNSVGGLFGEQILMPKLARFMTLHPEIKLELDFSSVREDLIEEKFDLVVRMGALTDSNLIGRRLTTYQNYLVASPHFIKEHPQITHPRELARYNLINGSVSKWRFQNSITREKYDHTVEAYLQCGNGHVACFSAIQGLGITRQPSYYVAEELKSGTLVSLLPEWPLASSEVNLLYPKSRHPSLRVQALIEFLVSNWD